MRGATGSTGATGPAAAARDGLLDVTPTLPTTPTPGTNDPDRILTSAEWEANNSAVFRGSGLTAATESSPYVISLPDARHIGQALLLSNLTNGYIRFITHSQIGRRGRAYTGVNQVTLAPGAIGVLRMTRSIQVVFFEEGAERTFPQIARGIEGLSGAEALSNKYLRDKMGVLLNGVRQGDTDGYDDVNFTYATSVSAQRTAIARLMNAAGADAERISYDALKDRPPVYTALDGEGSPPSSGLTVGERCYVRDGTSAVMELMAVSATQWLCVGGASGDFYHANVDFTAAQRWVELPITWDRRFPFYKVYVGQPAAGRLSEGAWTTIDVAIIFARSAQAPTATSLDGTVFTLPETPTDIRQYILGRSTNTTGGRQRILMASYDPGEDARPLRLRGAAS